MSDDAIEPDEATALRVACAGACLISAVLGLAAAALRALGPPGFTSIPGWPAVAGPILLGIGGGLVITTRRRYSGAVVLWLGALVTAIVFVAGHRSVGFADTTAAAALLFAGAATVTAIAAVHQSLVSDSAVGDTGDRMALPADIAVVSGILAWGAGAYLGVIALDAGTYQFAPEIFVVAALLASGSAAIGGGLLTTSPRSVSGHRDLLTFTVLVGVLDVAVVGDALAQLLSWLPWPEAADSGCCTGHPGVWHGALIALPAAYALACVVGIALIMRSRSATRRVLLARCLGWPLCAVMTAVLYEVARDIFTGGDFGGLYGFSCRRVRSAVDGPRSVHTPANQERPQRIRLRCLV